MSKVEKEVKKCDRCGCLYEAGVEHDYAITYLLNQYDLCDSCYNIVVPIIIGECTRTLEKIIVEEKDFIITC